VRQRADLLTQAASGDRKFWIYICFKFSRHEQNPIRQVKKLVDNALKCRVPGSKYGLLFDIVTTNSTIMSGAPHLLANQIYSYVDEMYSDRPGLKFVFVGITDNDNCRAARDVFCKEEQPGHPKKPFDAIDNTHMYAVYPFDEELTTKMIEQNNKQLAREAESGRKLNSTMRPNSPTRIPMELGTGFSVNHAIEEPLLPMTPRHTIQKRPTETTRPQALSPLKRKGRLAAKSVEICHEPTIKPVLPMARPFSAANPLDGSPYILQKPNQRLHHYEAIKTSKKIATVDFSFFVTQPSTLIAPEEPQPAAPPQTDASQISIVVDSVSDGSKQTRSHSSHSIELTAE
jgi:hypothetical protein